MKENNLRSWACVIKTHYSRNKRSNDRKILFCVIKCWIAVLQKNDCIMVKWPELRKYRHGHNMSSKNVKNLTVTISLYLRSYDRNTEYVICFITRALVEKNREFLWRKNNLPFWWFVNQICISLNQIPKN